MEPNMAETREERMQQRLRGAQRRQVKEVDFGLTFPTAPAQPQRAVLSQDPPHPAQLLSRTPGSVRGRGRPKATPAEKTTRPSNQSINDANTSAKRRQLSSKEPPISSSSSRSTRSSLHAAVHDIYALPEDESNEVAGGEASDNELSYRIGPEVVDQAEAVASILNLSNNKSRFSEALDQDSGAQINSETLRGQHSIREASNEPTQHDTEAYDSVPSTDVADMKTVSTAIPITQNKRKKGDAAQGKTSLTEKRQRTSRNARQGVDTSNNNAGQSSKTLRYSPRLSTPRSSSRIVEEADDHSMDEAEEIDDQEAAAVLNKNQNRRVTRSAEDSSTIESPIMRRKKPTKAPRSSITKQQQPRRIQPAISKPKTVPKKSKQSKQSRKQNPPLGSPIPVTVHRMTEKLYYEEDETDADILNSEIPYTKRVGVNAIDVLSQICEETITSSLDMLRELGVNADDSALRREYNTKCRAIESFGNELQTRLIEHTINLDNTFALEKRVRDEQRKKLALREEILRVRAEREQVALRMDEIRIKHENETQDARERDALNSTIHDLEMAVEQGKAKTANHGKVELTGIELVLKRVASEVSNKSSDGGILKQIKDFNSFLERTALALETRRT